MSINFDRAIDFRYVGDGTTITTKTYFEETEGNSSYLTPFMFPLTVLRSDKTSDYIGAISFEVALYDGAGTWTTLGKVLIYTYCYSSTQWKYRCYIYDKALATAIVNPGLGPVQTMGDYIWFTIYVTFDTAAKYSINLLLSDSPYISLNDKIVLYTAASQDMVSAQYNVKLKQSGFSERHDKVAVGDVVQHIMGPMVLNFNNSTPASDVQFYLQMKDYALLTDPSPYLIRSINVYDIARLDYQSEIDQLNSQIAVQQETINTLVTNLASANTKIDTLTVNLATANSSLSVAQTKLDTINTSSSNNYGILNSSSIGLAFLKSGFLNHADHGLPNLWTILTQLLTILNTLDAFLNNPADATVKPIIDYIGEMIMQEIEARITSDTWVKRILELLTTITQKIKVETY